MLSPQTFHLSQIRLSVRLFSDGRSPSYLYVRALADNYGVRISVLQQLGQYWLHAYQWGGVSEDKTTPRARSFL